MLRTLGCVEPHTLHSPLGWDHRKTQQEQVQTFSLALTYDMGPFSEETPNPSSTVITIIDKPVTNMTARVPQGSEVKSTCERIVYFRMQ